MSQIAREWVLSIEDQDLNGTRRLVLYLLAEHHNGDTGDCFPGRELLAREAGTTPRAVTRALNWLKETGYVKSARRHRSNGSRSSNGYVLTGLSDAGVTLDDGDAGLSDVRGQSKVTFEVIQGDAGVTPITGREPEGEQEEDVPTSSYVADKSLSTSTMDGAGAVEVEEEPSDNHPLQGINHDQDPQPLVAESETSRPRDEAEENGSGKEGGAQAAPDLPAELASLLASLSLGEATQTRRVWERSGCSMPTTFEYRRLRTGRGLPRVYRHSEAVAKLFPEAVAV